jgi:hypothetical protein
MTSKFDRIEREILDLRARRTFDGDHADMSDAKTRIGILRALVEGLPHEVEIRRHAIVSGIAALQSVRTMNSESGVAMRLADLVGEKYALRDTLEFIGGSRVSANELLAHLAPVNSVGDLISWMSKVFNDDFKRILSEAVLPWRRNEAGPRIEPIIAHVDEVFALLDKAFRLRHIWAHEAAPELETGHDETLQLLDAINSWMNGIDGALWMTLWRNVPLTQSEMNVAAINSFRSARKRLARALRRLRTHLGKVERARLAANHAAWRSNSHELVEMAYSRRSGSMWRSVSGEVIAEIFVERAQHVEGWAAAEVPI